NRRSARTRSSAEEAAPSALRRNADRSRKARHVGCPLNTCGISLNRLKKLRDNRARAYCPTTGGLLSPCRARAGDRTNGGEYRSDQARRRQFESRALRGGRRLSADPGDQGGGAPL